MIYVVLITGYEGIEQLVWAGTDPEEAMRRTSDLRDRLAKVNTRRTELKAKTDELLDGTEESSERFLEAEQKDWAILEAEFGKDMWLSGTPDHVCIQGYDPEADEFKCRCSSLDMSPSKPMYR